MRRTAPSARLIKRGAAVAPAVAVMAFPLAAMGTTHDPGARAASTTIALGQGFGGLTAQQWPIAFGVNVATTKIPWIAAGLDLKCTAGGLDSENDGYTGLRVSKRGTFGASFGPATQHNADGTSIVGQGRMKGKFNRSRLKASGTWKLKLTFIDAAGTVTDTCDSGRVRWRAYQ